LTLESKRRSWATGISLASKGHSKKRKIYRSVNNVEHPRHNKEYWPRMGEFEGSLDKICIFHPWAVNLKAALQQGVPTPRFRRLGAQDGQKGRSADQEKFEEPKGDCDTPCI
jgi:hypothetical protein